MSDIPADIVEMAINCVLRFNPSNDSRWAHFVAEAILAERERCAAIAEGYRKANDTGDGFDSQPIRATAFNIREAILRGDRPSPTKPIESEKTA